MKKKSLKKLSISKNTISGVGNIHIIGGISGGACNPAQPIKGPITIETICWTESRDIASDCWCSSDDSFRC